MNTIGATAELSLRVSVAALARVLFKHPENGAFMLALERKATLREGTVNVMSQPFGGAIRILNLDVLNDLLGEFHFDSQRSRDEQDFRLFIRPSGWSVIREFCIDHFSHDDDLILETDPTRELAEEFYDALKISLKPEQYSSKPVATVIENDPTPTDNIHAEGVPTVRVYRIFEVIISDSGLIDAMLANSDMVSDQDLRDLAIDDAQTGSKGRANAILAASMKQIHAAAYSAMPPAERDTSILFEQHQLDRTVTAVLDNITNPQYQRL